MDVTIAEPGIPFGPILWWPETGVKLVGAKETIQSYRKVWVASYCNGAASVLGHKEKTTRWVGIRIVGKHSGLARIIV